MWRPRSLRGATNKALLLAVASLGVSVLLILMLAWPKRSSDAPLLVYCASGLTRPVEECCREFRNETGQNTHLQIGGTQSLLANIEVTQSGDVFIPADESSWTIAKEKNLVTDESAILARLRPVLAFQKGKSRAVRSLAEALAANLRLSLADPDSAAIGKITREALEPLGLWQKLKNSAAVFKPTVNDVLADIQIGAVDAGVVWDALVSQHDDLEFISPVEFGTRVSLVRAGVLRSSEQPDNAAKLLRFLAAADRGGTIFAKHGFASESGPMWGSREITLYAGALLRPAIEETIQQFEKREGVKVNCVYNGCGILVSQMKAGKTPDAYFACDRQFMKQVNEIFPDAVEIASNELVILVAKGNPHQIASLADLAKPGLRVGVGHEQQCALGQITKDTFKQAGLSDRIEKNVSVRVPTGDSLVNAMRIGSLDAAVAYLANAVNSADVLDAVRIQGLPCATAVQPFGIAKDSPQRALSQHLLAALRSSASQQRFRQNGFQWIDPGPPAQAAPAPIAPVEFKEKSATPSASESPAP